VKVTLIVQKPNGAIGEDDAQLSVSVKSPLGTMLVTVKLAVPALVTVAVSGGLLVPTT
jgi:hypothetical protein